MGKTYLDIDSWDRKVLYRHFIDLQDPTFGLVADVDVTNAFTISKLKGYSFFAMYLYACTKAVNAIENFKYRIEQDGRIAVYDVIHAGATMPKPNHTFLFSQIHYSESFPDFLNNYINERNRVLQSDTLYPPNYSVNCFHSSAIPWVNFSSHKEPISGQPNIGIPQFSFGKYKNQEGKLLMPVAINVNHALIDGYHVGQFFDFFQEELNKFE